MFHCQNHPRFNWKSLAGPFLCRITALRNWKESSPKARAELQRAAEERQSSQEEMTSMNEELQSTNEELQSTNEELTTSKEELQSLNEELLTVNAELQSKIEAFSQSHDDMRNLLRTTKIPMLFLDSSLRVRRFTDVIKPIISLISNDVGRSITDLKVNLLDESFVNDVRDVLDTLQFKERQVETTEGMWFQMRVMPYRTSENRINGVAVTFNDISAIKELEKSLQEAKSYAQSIVETVSGTAHGAEFRHAGRLREPLLL